MTAIVDFYAGLAPDIHGRMMTDILAWDDAKLETSHDYIQWLFPLPEPSAHSATAPVLTDADIAAFHDRPELHSALERSLTRMRAFYGLPGTAVRRASWATAGNHNLFRLTRILRSLHLLGLEHEALVLYRDLEALYKAGAGPAIGAETLGYWRLAAQ